MRNRGKFPADETLFVAAGAPDEPVLVVGEVADCGHLGAPPEPAGPALL